MSEQDDVARMRKAMEGLSHEDKVALAVASIVSRAWDEECKVSCTDPRKPRYFEVQRRGTHVSVLDCTTGARRRLTFEEAEKRSHDLEEKILQGSIRPDEFHDLAHLLVALLCHERARGRAMVLPFGDPPVVVSLREKGDDAELFVGKYRPSKQS